MIIQLNPHIPLMTPKGEGICHFLIDYSIEDNLYWVVFINDTGECWTFSNPEIRACKNITVGRNFDKDEKINSTYCENNSKNLLKIAEERLNFLKKSKE